MRYPRVTYRRTGLSTVICQLRFNAILRISQESPADFQGLVRGTFPKFVQEQSAEFLIGAGGVEALPAKVGAFRFRTEDDAWTAGLAADNISLETSQYQDFPDFESKLSIVEEALRSVYQIDHYVRVGLRYVNIFGPEDFPGGWQDKFNPQLLGPLADEIIGSSAGESRQVFQLAEDDWTIAVRHGTEDSKYRLDLDHATETRVEARDVFVRLGSFSERIYQVFRWSISEAMHQQMEPEANE